MLFYRFNRGLSFMISILYGPYPIKGLSNSTDFLFANTITTLQYPVTALFASNSKIDTMQCSKPVNWAQNRSRELFTLRIELTRHKVKVLFQVFQCQGYQEAAMRFLTRLTTAYLLNLDAFSIQTIQSSPSRSVPGPSVLAR